MDNTLSRELDIARSDAARKDLIDKALFAERLRVALAKKEWSPTELARHLTPAPTRATTNAWANSNNPALPSAGYVLQLPAVLGVEADWLFPRVASGDTPRPGVVSESFRAPLMEHAERERVRVLADRIARAVQTTVAANELGYTPTTRAHIAASLEAFAKEIEDRCGPGSAGDIWRVIVWLNKQHD